MPTSAPRLAAGDAVYDPIARYYDLDHAGFDDDLAFYQEFARAAVGPLLDVGVGTGRVAIPLAAQGHTVYGVDPSRAMLARARRRADAAGVAARLHLLPGDAATCALPERCALAYLALNTFSHFLTPPEQLAVLSNLRRQLRPGGRLLIDQWNPYASAAPDSSGQWVFGYRRQAADGRWVTQSVASSADNAAQLLHTTIVYDEEVPAGPVHRTRRGDARGPGTASAISAGAPGGLPAAGAAVRRTVVTMRLRYFYRYEVEWLLLAAGYELEAVFGSYDLVAYTADSPRLIWLARTERAA